jgi:hypothetical protein
MKKYAASADRPKRTFANSIDSTLRINTLLDMEDLQRLALLLKQMNTIGNEISKIIQRPALTGHLGEFIAGRIFDIDLEPSATSRGKDGRFRTGVLVGQTVNVKCYPKLESLDMREDSLPEVYLVLTGPRSPTATSRGTSRPFVIDHVFLFEAEALCGELRSRGVKIQTGTSLLRAQWNAAEVYPHNTTVRYTFSDAQRAMLALFNSPDA